MTEVACTDGPGSLDPLGRAPALATPSRTTLRARARSLSFGVHHDCMDVEATAKDGGPRPWLVPLHRWLAVLAWIVGGLLVFFVVLNYALTPLYDVFAPGHMDAFADVVVLSSSVLWWILVTTSGLAAVLLVVCWPKDELPARRALALIGAGLVAYWPWKLLDGWLDLWGIRSPAEATPEIVRLATVDAILSQTITVVSACLMIAGAVRVNRGALKLDPRS